MIDMKKINVILDTDICNEIDDRYAIAYLLANDDKLNIEAITIAPYKVDYQNISIGEGQELSYNECLKIFNIFNKCYPLYKGSCDVMDNGYKEITPAVQAIIDICRKNDETIIFGVGAITNIALAMCYAPDIINKMKILWLGTGHPFNRSFNDTNFKVDKSAFRFVYERNADLTIISTIMAKANRLSEAEIEKRLKKSSIKNYLLDCLRNFYYYKSNGKSFTLHDVIPIDMVINSNDYIVEEIDKPELTKQNSFKFCKNNKKVKFLVWSNHYKTITNFFDKLNDVNLKNN